MIEKKTINNISSKIRSIYFKGIEAIEKNSHDYAVDLLKTVVIMEPGFLLAREKLRSLEKTDLISSPIKKFLKSLKIKKIIKMGQLDLVRKKYKEAYSSAEEALAIDVKNLSALNLLAETAEATNDTFIVIETYELALEFYPKNSDILRKLANAYRDSKMGAKELNIRQKLLKMFPGDMQIESELRSASASAILEKHDLENDDSLYIEKMKKSEKVQILEQKDRIIHHVDDAQKLISSLEKELNDNPDSVETIRKLGELYQTSGAHSTALEYFKKLEKINDIFDITIDRAMERSELALIKNEILDLSALIKNDSPEIENLNEKVEKLNQKLINIKEAYAVKRVNLYPNNLLLRYSLALTHFEKKEFDSAIEQFQLSQQNMQYHTSSILLLGRCFMFKNQFDIAIEQFKKIVDDFPTMTKEKIEALYYLGISYESINDSINAMVCFKQIYSTQSTYKDVSMRIKKYYK